MLYIDENTDRATLEVAAIDANFDLNVIEAASDEELRNMIVAWVMAGDECLRAA